MDQTTSNLLLIKPRNFNYNPETATTNVFQEQNNFPVAELAVNEFNLFVEQLQSANINAIVYNDKQENASPDAVFPNNWVSFHADGKVVLYPMATPSRRRERRHDIVESLSNDYSFGISEIIDLSYFEKNGQFLEGTGSIVFDHPAKVAYMALSGRSQKEPFQKLLDILGYRGYTFETMHASGQPVYHTNVVLSIFRNLAVCSFDSLLSSAEKNRLSVSLEQSNKTLMAISEMQMNAFAGNMLEVKNNNGEPYLLLSATAWKTLNGKQKSLLEKQGNIVHVPIPTIEKFGGGSVRCMVAEIFLPGNREEKIRVVHPVTADDFEKYFELRYKVLRQPWNKPKGSERDDADANSIHFMALINSEMAGVGMLQYNSNKVAQVRYMAVADKYRGKGIGKIIMQKMEARAFADGRKEIFLQAREIALGFYKSLGYSVIEKTFLLFDEIQHYSMNKML